MKNWKAIVFFGLLFSLVLSLPGFDSFFDKMHERAPWRPHARDPQIPQTKALNERAYRVALDYFKAHRPQIQNRRFLTIIDYTKPSHMERLYIVDLHHGNIEKHLVAHARKSGHVYAVRFSNEIESRKSCKGFFLTGRRYIGKHGPTLALHGLEREVNDNALVRGIVIHGADYVSPLSVWLNGGHLGRSWGCPAVPVRAVNGIVDKLKGGSLVYVHAR